MRKPRVAKSKDSRYFEEEVVNRCLSILCLSTDSELVRPTRFGCLMNLTKDSWISIDLRNYPERVDYIHNSDDDTKYLSRTECREIWDTHIKKVRNLELLQKKI